MNEIPCKECMMLVMCKNKSKELKCYLLNEYTTEMKRGDRVLRKGDDFERRIRNIENLFNRSLKTAEYTCEKSQINDVTLIWRWS